MPLFVPKALQGLYIFCEEIAEGSFGNLYLAIHALTRQKVAIKVMDKRKIGSEVFRIRGEIDALKKLSHPNIYALYQVIETDCTFFLILEYVPGGELFDFILQQGKLAESDARGLFRQLVSAIGYSHAKGIAHRDLKPENILMKDEQTVRVIDYGLCAKNTDDTFLNTYCGSLAYAAPEVLSNQEYNGFAADIWSLGVILYATLRGCLPFDPTKPEKLAKIVIKGHYVVDETMSENVRDLLARMMCVDPAARIKMPELCEHPWFLEDEEDPIDLFADLKPPQPLNQDVLKEISAYMMWPIVEIARMVRKKSYDYLMATYAIMERMYQEDGVLLLLQPRTQSNRAMVEAAARAATVNTPRDRRSMRPPGNNISNGGFLYPTPHNRFDNSEFSTPIPLTPAQFNGEDVQFTRRPAIARLSYKPYQPRISEQIKPMTLSPGRSVDSQLNELCRSQRLTERQRRRPPSMHLEDQANSSDEGGFYDQLAATKCYDSSGVMITSSNQSMASMASGNEKLAAMKQLISRKNTSVVDSQTSETHPPAMAPAAGTTVVSVATNATTSTAAASGKLRKVRASNNVIRIRAEVTAAEAIKRISEALRRNSIRFTLKRNGFTCTFANDWGRTLLEFELEVVQVTGKFALPKLLQPKKASSAGGLSIMKNGSRGSCTEEAVVDNNGVAVVVVDRDKTPPGGSRASSIGSYKAAAASDSQHQQTLGVKVKRLHGDSFTYASICRTVLDLAGIKTTSDGK